MTTIDEKSAQRMKAIRAALGMTQRDMAFYLRVAVNTVSNWETGRTAPSGLAQRAIRALAVEQGLDLHTLRRYPS